VPLPAKWLLTRPVLDVSHDPLLVRMAHHISVISKLQISNATKGGHERSILLALCKAKRAGFSNPVIFGSFDDSRRSSGPAGCRLKPNYVDAYINLGDALLEKVDVNGAIAEYGTAIRLNPNDAAAHVSLAMAFLENGDVEGEIAEFRIAARLDPKNAYAHGNLAAALSKKGDERGALEQNRIACSLSSKDSKVDYCQLARGKQ
jgi:tetratricopeptide (TPR) repeat protein